MDEDLPSQYLPDHIDSDLTGDNSGMPAACSFCGRTLSSESGINSNLRSGSICGDCKFLLLEDYGNPSLQYHHSRPLRDMDRSSSYHQPTSMHTTPDSSRRWRRVISDAESDGFTSDSFFAESESNVSFSGAYRVSYVDSDAVSFSGYGGDSDVSVDGPAFLDADIFAQSMERSDVESDSDIDPMHAGVLQWDFDQDYEEYLEQLVENDGLRRGAPPTSASFVDCLPLIVISEDHQKKSEGLVCAICKDLLTIGIEVNRLPCLHLYHPPCILPWLSARNSCPLCRYELPTDDLDYELRKRNSNRMIISQIQEHDGRDDSSSVSNDGRETDDGGPEFGGMLRNVGPTSESSDNGGRRGRWLFLAAAPIVSIVGVVFVMWLGNSLSGRVGQTRQHPQGTRTSDSGPHNQRVRRRWWF